MSSFPYSIGIGAITFILMLVAYLLIRTSGGGTGVALAILSVGICAVISSSLVERENAEIASMKEIPAEVSLHFAGVKSDSSYSRGSAHATTWNSIYRYLGLIIDGAEGTEFRLKEYLTDTNANSGVLEDLVKSDSHLIKYQPGKTIPTYFYENGNSFFIKPQPRNPIHFEIWIFVLIASCVLQVVLFLLAGNLKFLGFGLSFVGVLPGLFFGLTYFVSFLNTSAFGTRVFESVSNVMPKDKRDLSELSDDNHVFWAGVSGWARFVKLPDGQIEYKTSTVEKSAHVGDLTFSYQNSLEDYSVTVPFLKTSDPLVLPILKTEIGAIFDKINKGQKLVWSLQQDKNGISIVFKIRCSKSETTKPDLLLKNPSVVDDTVIALMMDMRARKVLGGRYPNLIVPKFALNQLDPT